MFDSLFLGSSISASLFARHVSGLFVHGFTSLAGNASVNNSFVSNSAASVTGVACFGNALSILGQVAIGSSFSVQSFVWLGLAVSVDAGIFAHDRLSVAAGIQAVGVLSTSAAMLADTCRASAISAVVHGNAISIPSATRLGDLL